MIVAPRDVSDRLCRAGRGRASGGHRAHRRGSRARDLYSDTPGLMRRVLLPAAHAGNHRRRDAGLYPLARRFRHQFFYLRPDPRPPCPFISIPRSRRGVTPEVHAPLHHYFYDHHPPGHWTGVADSPTKGTEIMKLLFTMMIAFGMLLAACSQPEQTTPRPGKSPSRHRWRRRIRKPNR